MGSPTQKTVAVTFLWTGYTRPPAPPHPGAPPPTAATAHAAMTTSAHVHAPVLIALHRSAERIFPLCEGILVATLIRRCFNSRTRARSLPVRMMGFLAENRGGLRLAQ